MAGRIVGEEMRAYYDRRAPGYDDWWFGTGGFAARERPGWFDEVDRLFEVVRSLSPAKVLDVACGTGYLTRHLAGEVTGIDQSHAMVAIAAERLPGARIVRGEAVPLPFPAGSFDRVFTGHFYGHLLEHERRAFLGEARRVAGELVVVDSAVRDDTADGWQVRELGDGSRHRVYKRFFTAEGLADELGGGRVLHDGDWFVAVASPAPAGPEKERGG
ncbi:MAG TPA: class I SAM-dependent methyltransferase [Thermoleophilaceae bacterium]|nr:class I SAM-dependent methyltransferase [Thermoleophilaceae bacterium]